MRVTGIAGKTMGKTLLYLLMTLLLSGCSFIPDLPGPIGIPGI